MDTIAREEATEFAQSGRDIIRYDTWKHWLGNSPAHSAIFELLQLITTPGYTCLRPPGAAGAFFIPNIRYDDIIVGYVKPPHGSPTCKEVGCEIEDGHCVRTIHAECNAIYKAARIGMPTDEGIIYSLLKPCYQCSKAIAAAGITRVYYAGAAYDEERTRLLLEHAGVACKQIQFSLGYGG